MLKNTLVIVHYQPLEYYPPIQNIIQFLQENLKDVKIYVITTIPVSEKISRFKAGSGDINIIPVGKPGANDHKIKRLGHYLFFSVRTLWELCKKRPKKVLYFETLSSFPVYLYKKMINTRAEILIHYHEYTSPVEYQHGMAIARKFHQFENYLYPRAIWVSHTNEDRMQKFIEDIKPVGIQAPRVLPNYPPLSWKKAVAPAKKGDKLLIVYAGALGIDTMYLREFAEWVEAQEGSVLWDIYSQQEGGELIALLAILKTRYIQFKGSVSYQELPEILVKYDVGVILYKGHIPNYVFNAPNKLFEYAGCGLDVWFPEQMLGSLPYATTGSFPKIVSFNFEKLKQQITRDVFSHEGLDYKPSTYFCENVLPALLQKLN
jgi:hypothetical protein